MVDLRVVQPIQEVNRARAGGGEAHAQPTGEFRVPAGHEGAHFLVARREELDLLLIAGQGADDSVDPAE
jgi:hypothetical protein